MSLLSFRQHHGVYHCFVLNFNDRVILVSVYRYPLILSAEVLTIIDGYKAIDLGFEGVR